MIKSVKYIVTIFLLIFSTSGFSQSKLIDRWSFHADAVGGVSSYMKLNDWITDFNETLYWDLDKKFNKLLGTGGFRVGTSFVLREWFYIGFDFESTYQKTFSRSLNPVLPTRHLGLNTKMYALRLGSSLQVDDNLSVIITFPMGIQQLYLDSYMKYPNGKITFDNENIYNGKFSSTFNFNFDVSIEVAYDINKHISVFGSWMAGFGGSWSIGLSDNGKPLNFVSTIDSPISDYIHNSMNWHTTLNAGIKFNIINNQY